ncbi:MAG: hypothetical protein ASARMPREDX12_001356 [Alectoria sarmentosa]|nr:MAG: hypothetical protein ASARMPREDX12_001356 [Alectoria sarmentosa]
MSFPLPRRPSASTHTTPGSQYSNQRNIDDSPLSHPGAKAEKVLGALDADSPELKKKQSRKAKKQLRKYPSFMSVTLSDVDAESVKTPDEFPFPGMHTPSEMISQLAQNKGRQGSSPLLGEHFMLGSTNADTRSNASSPRAHRAKSFSTLPSHYDSKKSPLSISQQTSASSARDMALRKGYPPISSPLSLNTAGAVKSTELDGLHSRSISTDTKISGTSKLSCNSVKRINSIPRRRPSVMDPPTLYPNAHRAFHAVSPPPALINTALPKPLAPQSHQKLTFSRPRWWAKVKTQMPPPTSIEDQQRHEGFENSLPSIKLNVKRPKPAMQNWFDGLEDERTPSDDHQDTEVSKYRILKPHEPPLSIQEVMTQGAPSPRIWESQSSFSSKNEPITLSNRKPTLRFNSPPTHSLYSRSSSQASEGMSTPGSTPGSPEGTSREPTIGSKGPTRGMDLQSVSFLELSSSEDEMESNSDAPYRRHRIRASVEKASYNNEVSVGNAQRAQPVRPRSIINGRTRPLSRRSNSSERVPPVPKIPDKPMLSQRNSSVRWREMMEDKAGSTESTVDSGESSLNSSIDVRRARIRAKQSIRRSKFMKVTSEEEKLLEAMRDKRASIRQDDFDKGFKTAMQLQDIVARPKTAGEDVRACRSSNYGSRSSPSPLPREFAVKTSRTNSGFSASAEDPRLEDAYPFPEVPLNRKGPPGSIPPPKPSPSLSFSPSDVLPETPASQNSPVTPPPGHGALDTYDRSLRLSPPRGIMAMDKISHEKKRTVSSSLVDLDGVEQQAQVMDEDGVSRWAMDRW